MTEWLSPDEITLVWTGIVGFAVIMYVVLDGFDLGIGILFPFAPRDEDRDIMMGSVAPIWDFNETWLILGGAGLFAAFPLAYALLLPALYLPFLAMLLALIFRGVAFEFRFKARRSRFLWDRAFNLGSFTAAFAQGLVLGSFVQGIPVADRQFIGGPWDWLTPFSLLCGCALVCGYGLLGATWTIWRTEGELQAWARRAGKRLMLGVLVFIGLVSLWTPFLGDTIAARWFSWPNILILSPVPLVTAGFAVLLWRTLGDERFHVRPFGLAIALFIISYGGLAISLWPHIVPPSVTLWDAASPPETQVFLLVGLAFLLPTILVYTAYSYWVFRGKVTGDSSAYH